MKTQTNRIHRNGAAKAAKSQAKTSRRKPENVHIVINDEAGKAFADFEITKAMHLAIERDCQAKGISPMSWIENAARGRLKQTTTAGTR